MIRRMVGRQVLKKLSGGRVKDVGKLQALMRLPVLLRLGYALFRDARVPLWMRVSVLGLLVLVFSPLDFIGDIPLIGQFWDFTLAVFVLDAFVQMAPAHVVNEHIRALHLEKRVPLRTT